MRTKEVCAECGSDDIEGLAWIKINSHEFVDWQDESDVWCKECDKLVSTRIEE